MAEWFPICMNWLPSKYVIRECITTVLSNDRGEHLTLHAKSCHRSSEPVIQFHITQIWPFKSTRNQSHLKLLQMHYTLNINQWKSPPLIYFPSHHWEMNYEWTSKFWADQNTQVPQKALWALKPTVKKMICYGKHHHPFKWGFFQDWQSVRRNLLVIQELKFNRKSLYTNCKHETTSCRL